MLIQACDKCHRFWVNEYLKLCTCGNDLSYADGQKHTVIGFTEVKVPSVKHPDVPYYVYVLEDEDGQRLLHKSHSSYSLGDAVELTKPPEKIGVVGIIGTGVMGRGLVELLMLRGYRVIVKSRSTDGLKNLKQQLSYILLKGQSPEAVNDMLTAQVFTTEYNDLRNVNLLIEAIAEDRSLKASLFKDLDSLCCEDTIFATNTSSLSVKDLSKSTSRPDRFLGLHFFNPVKQIKLVEVVRTEETSEEVVTAGVSFAESLGKSPVIVKDSPGFIVNRILFPYLAEALNLFGEGSVQGSDIDKAVRLGLNHPMGPFELMDLIGTDIIVGILNNLFEQTGEEKYIPHMILKEMVSQGRLGRKSGKGFYDSRKA